MKGPYMELANFARIEGILLHHEINKRSQLAARFDKYEYRSINGIGRVLNAYLSRAMRGGLSKSWSELFPAIEDDWQPPAPDPEPQA